VNDGTELGLLEYRDGALTSIEYIHVVSAALNCVYDVERTLLLTDAAEDEQELALVVVLEHTSGLEVEQIDRSVCGNVDISYL